MSELIIFNVPLKPDKQNYDEIKFSDEFKGTPEDVRCIKDKVENIQNSTEIKNIYPVKTSIGTVLIRFEPTEGRFKSIEGFMNFEDKAIQQSASDSDDSDKQESSQSEKLYVYEVFLKGGVRYTATALYTLEEKEKYIFVQPENNRESFVLISAVSSIIRQLKG